MTTSRTAIVTGATQGLGFALVAGLAARLRPADRVLLTGRDHRRVAAAVARVGAGIGTASARVEGRVLDVTDPDAIQQLADELRDRDGGVDIVISNAAARTTPDRTEADQVDVVVDTNNLGTLRVLRSFGPVLRPGGRLIVVASSLGTLGHLDPAVHHLFDQARSLADVAEVLASWRAAVQAGTAVAQGWPGWLNVPSKVAQVAAVRVVAAQRRDEDLRCGTLVAAVCPGMIDTEASRPWFEDMSDAQTPDQAAAAVLDLVLSDGVDPAMYGQLVRFGKVLSWRDDVSARRSVRASRTA